MELLSMRAGIDQSPEMMLCHHHERTVLQEYASLQGSCFNPFLRHEEAAKRLRREITLDASKYYIRWHEMAS